MKRLGIENYLLLGLFLAAPISRADEILPSCLDRYHVSVDFLANPDESDLIARAIGWCREHKIRLLWDERYASVARSWSKHLLESNPDTERMLPVDRLRFDLHRLGVTDAHMKPFSSVAIPNKQTVSVLEFLDREAQQGRFNIFGIGVARTQDQKETSTTILIGRRQAIIEPMPVCPLPAERIRLGLRLVPGYRHPSWLLAKPDGAVISGSLAYQEGSWLTEVPLDGGRGTYQMEVLVYGPNGPEVAALYPLYVGINRPELPIVKLRPAPQRYKTPQEAEKALANLINMERSRRHLPGIVLDDCLGKVARQHSLQVLNERHAVHRTATGSLQDRLRRAKVRFIRALENVSLSINPETAHERFLESPSHRRNMLDPNVTHLGIGIAMERTSSEDILAICELFVEKSSPADLTRLVDNLLKMINSKRKQRGRFALGLDKQLTRYAHESARRLSAGPTQLDPQHENKRLLQEISDSNLAVIDTRVYTLRTINPRNALLNPDLLDENINRIGIGVSKTNNLEYPEEIWISLIFAGR